MRQNDDIFESLQSRAIRLDKPPGPKQAAAMLADLEKYIDRHAACPPGPDYYRQREALAVLYRQFVRPPTGKTAKDPLDWCRLALDPKDPRRWPRVLMVMKGMACGSDGFRIHFAPTELADGCYDSNNTPVDIDGTPPDVTAYLGREPGYLLAHPSDWTRGMVRDVPALRLRLNDDVPVLRLNDDLVVNERLLLAALNVTRPDKTPDTIEIRWTGRDNDPLMIDHGDGRRAVVMPLRT